LLASEEVRYNSAINGLDASVQKELRANFKAQKDAISNALLKSASSGVAARQLKMIQDQYRLSATEAAPYFTMLEAMTGGGAAMEGLITGLTLTKLNSTLMGELNDAIGGAKTVLSSDKKANVRALLQLQNNPNSTKNIDPDDVGEGFQTSLHIMNRILNVHVTEMHDNDPINYGKQVVISANLAMAHGRDPDKLLTLTSQYYGSDKALRMMDTLKSKNPELAQQVNRKILSTSYHGLREALKGVRDVGVVPSVMGPGRKAPPPRSGGIEPSPPPAEDIAGVELGASEPTGFTPVEKVTLAYDPARGKFIPVRQGGVPVEDYSPDADRLNKQELLLNDTLDTVVAHKKYDPVLSLLSDTEVRNLYVSSLASTVRTDSPILVAGGSFPKPDKKHREAIQAIREGADTSAAVEKDVGFDTNSRLDRLFGTTRQQLRRFHNPPRGGRRRYNPDTKTIEELPSGGL